MLYVNPALSGSQDGVKYEPRLKRQKGDCLQYSSSGS